MFLEKYSPMQKYWNNKAKSVVFALDQTID